MIPSRFAKLEGMIGGKPDDHDYLANRQTLTPIDWSAHPVDNSIRNKKLGGRRGTYSAYICDYDLGSHRTIIADGFFGGDVTQMPFEPDSVAMRYHKKPNDPNPNRKERVWSYDRWIVDRENNQGTFFNRSTPVICQRDEQFHTDIHNLHWVLKVPALRIFLQEQYDKAGMLSGVCGASPDIATIPTLEEPVNTPHLCLAINTRGGHWTDGNRIAQPWHLFSIPNESTGGYDDIITHGKGDRKKKEKRTISFSELMIRADGKFLGKQSGFISIDCAQNPATAPIRARGPMSIDEDDRAEFNGVPISGHMCWSLVGRLNTLLPEDELNDDPKDDSIPLSRLANHFLRPFVCLPIATPEGEIPPEPPPPDIPTEPGNRGYGGTRFRGTGDTDSIHTPGEPYVTGMTIDEAVDLPGLLGEIIEAFHVFGIFSDGKYYKAIQSPVDTVTTNVIGIMRADAALNDPLPPIDRIEGTAVRIKFDAALTPDEGQFAWLSASTPGRATNIKPPCGLLINIGPPESFQISSPWQLGIIEDISDYAVDQTCIIRLRIEKKDCECLFSCGETPLVTPDGVSTIFVLHHVPHDSSCVELYKNGLLQNQGAANDYTIVADAITFNAANIPQTGDILEANYEYGCPGDPSVIIET